jgi:hypothetical protein
MSFLRENSLSRVRGNFLTAFPQKEPMRNRLVRIFVGSLVVGASGLCAAGQSPAASTVNKFLPEADFHAQFQPNWRVLAFSGLEQAVDYPYRQWYAATGLGYQAKPIVREHLLNVDPDKEHYLVVGAGYEFLRTTQSANIKHENRITIDVTPGFRPAARLLMRDRNWTELRWVDGKYSTTYRNQLSVERDFRVGGFRFTPNGSVEVFYDSPKHSWDEEWYTAGVQWPYKRLFMLDTYYRREHCVTCTPQNWNVGGITLHFFFAKSERASD